MDDLEGELIMTQKRNTQYRTEIRELRAAAVGHAMELDALRTQLKTERAAHRKEMAKQVKCGDQAAAAAKKRIQAQDKEIARVKASALVTAQDLQLVKRLHVSIVDQCERLRMAFALAEQQCDELSTEKSHAEGKVLSLLTALTMMEHKVRCAEEALERHGITDVIL